MFSRMLESKKWVVTAGAEIETQEKGEFILKNNKRKFETPDILSNLVRIIT